MTPDHLIASIQIAVAAIFPLGGAFLAVRLSLRRFRSERWWEIQQQAYCHLLENLAILKHRYERELEYGEHPDYAEGPNALLIDQCPGARSEVEKSSTIGELYISQKASVALDRCVEMLNIDLGCGPERNNKEYLKALKECIECIRREAVSAMSV